MQIDKSKPSYSRESDLIELIIMMHKNYMGVSLEEICDKFNVSRRTAERMRDSLINSGLNIEVVQIDGKIKRWGFVTESLPKIIKFTDEEITTMELIKHQMSSSVFPELNSIIDKMKALRVSNR